MWPEGAYAALGGGAAAVGFGGSVGVQGWLWVPAFIVIGAVSTFKLLPECALKPCMWTGVISSSLFVVHPVLREIIIPMSRRGQVFTGIVIYLVASVLCAWLFMKLLKFIPKPKSI